MKKLLTLIIFHLSLITFAQTSKVVSFVIHSKALQNKGGEDPNRKVSVYSRCSRFSIFDLRTVDL